MKIKNIFSLIVLAITCYFAIINSSCQPVNNEDDNNQSSDDTSNPGYLEVLDVFFSHRYVDDGYGNKKLIESWQYTLNQESVVAYAKYNYDSNGDNVLTLIYDGYSFDNTTDPLSDHSVINKFVYQYDNHCIVKAEAYDDSNILQEWYEASYNLEGNYTNYIHYKGTGTSEVLEHRTATYDPTGLHYIVETRYYGASDATSDIKEQWICNYGDMTDDGIFLEEKYLKRIKDSTNGTNWDSDIDGTTDSNAGYVSEFLFTFTWDAGKNYRYLTTQYELPSHKIMGQVFYDYDTINSLYLVRKQSKFAYGDVKEYRLNDFNPNGAKVKGEVYLYDGPGGTRRLSSKSLYKFFNQSFGNEMCSFYNEEIYSYYYTDVTSGSASRNYSVDSPYRIMKPKTVNHYE